MIYSDKKASKKVNEATEVQDSAPKAEPTLEEVEVTPIEEKIVEEVAPLKEEAVVEKSVDEVETAAGVKAAKLKDGEAFGVVKTINGLNLRQMPNTSSAVVKVLNNEELITIDTTYKNPTWYKVKTYDNKRGFAMKKWIVLK